MPALNETHDPSLKSFVASAQAPGCDFTIQNLPFAVFRRKGKNEQFRGGVAIGDQVLDLAAVCKRDLLSGDAREAAESCIDSTLNAYMALGPEAWSALRLALSRLLRTDTNKVAEVRGSLLPMQQVEYAMPARIGDYTDFYASIQHATNVGRMFRPDNPLLPNYKWVPIGYHGRSSSVAISGQRFPRPVGQRLPPGADTPVVGPSQRLDYELEMGIFVGPGNALGTRIGIDEADHHVFGLCLLNDWSARDLQAWEYQPLGPFLSKSFATTISPWVVSLEALAPYRVPWSRPEGDPQPLPYLDSPGVRDRGAIDIALEAWIATERMQREHTAPACIAHSNLRYMYWTIEQLVTHHTINGCNLQPGDLLGTGTQSGPGEDAVGSLLELTQGGKRPLQLPNGETRTFLQDGDIVALRAYAEADGKARVGFGEAAGQVLPAVPI
ncbi:MAG TPA: fumarylacetoacetase [Casimicrobiaceae bacterium]|nr:fumarylacetoacetase [Casimicrobiaceae bacterium]